MTLSNNFLFWGFGILVLFLIPFSTTAQITPAGLGKTQTSSWLALGVKQDLDTLKTTGWQSTTYIAAGRMSNPDNYDPFYKQGVLILNQEFKNRFKENWEYSLALSYRRQNKYEKEFPFEENEPGLKQEFRLYGRFSYIFKTSFVEITPTFRQEFQKYYGLNFEKSPENIRIRSRFRLKFAIPLTEDKVHRLILFSEQLFSISQRNDSKKWTDFEYKDSRFSIYYSLAPNSIPFTFNLGYMNNLIGTKKAVSTHYFGIDVIWKNPLKVFN